MRIHLSLEPSHFAAQPVAGPSSSPLAQLGGELVIIELQGELGWEGSKEGGVVGVLGLDRPDKPTLHLGEHHLLHGKFTTLQKPLAVIRRAVAAVAEVEGVEGVVEGDAEEEEESEEDEGEEEQRSQKASELKGKKRKSNDENGSNDRDVPILSDYSSLETPLRRRPQVSSSPFPFDPPSSAKDYSSELDFSSPPDPMSNWMGRDDEDDEDDNEDDEDTPSRPGASRKRSGKGTEGMAAKKQRTDRPERTRVYEVVAVVRRKVVFALRPEPIVTATILPE